MHPELTLLLSTFIEAVGVKTAKPAWSSNAQMFKLILWIVRNNNIIQQLRCFAIKQLIICFILTRLKGHPGASCVSGGVFGYTHSAHPVTSFLNRSLWRQDDRKTILFLFSMTQVQLRAGSDPLCYVTYSTKSHKMPGDKILFFFFLVTDVLLQISALNAYWQGEFRYMTQSFGGWCLNIGKWDPSFFQEILPWSTAFS